jgi:asparagine synthase (glutamine-hydrolysing)
MCGITGYINLDGSAASAVILKKMTDAIAHRGPDGEGQWVETNVGIGHRRLAILDLSPAGHQPMVSADHRWVLSYNGEVYNYRELRADLEAEGVWFRSLTDTEVVLHALATWGTDALLKFNGMFALALWDRKKRALLLARDRYGIKPLYYNQQDKIFSFASEQKAICAQPHFRKILNKPALLEYFTFQNIFTDQTLLQGIHILPAGHYLSLQDCELTPRLQQYWDYRFGEPSSSRCPEETVEELDRLFRQAIHRQLISDVEVGAYLSGGIDSGSITAVAVRSLPNLKTFTCGFDLSSASGIELGFDERAKAEAMSARFKTEHYEMVLKAGDMERALPAVARHLEEPRVGQSYPNYYAARLTSKFVKVVLSGCGADELFGGYPWRYYQASEIASFDQYIERYYQYWQRLVNNTEIKAMFAPVWGEVKDVWTRDIFRNVFMTHESILGRPEEYINCSLYFEAKTFLHGLFVVEDKLSMAHGLETRVPFMDNDLVEFAMTCPVSFKLGSLASLEQQRIDENEAGDKPQQYYQKTREGKKILREMIGRYVPAEIASMTKQGFSSPDASWFKGESIDFVQRTLLHRQARIYDLFDRSTVMELVGQHLKGEKNRRLLIWSLLNLEEMMNQIL